LFGTGRVSNISSGLIEASRLGIGIKILTGGKLSEWKKSEK
jgi:hypothetical protein